jgi:hypothetical protein
VSEESRAPGRWTVVRDIGSFTLGWVLIFQQAMFVDPTKVKDTFLWVAVTLITTPVGAETLVRLRAFLAGTSPSDSGSLPPASPSSSPGTSGSGGSGG